MSTADTTEQTPAATSTDAQPARTARRWPWIVALVVVAALGATGTGIATASASSASAELQEARSEYADLETRADILASSLDLIRDHRDRLQVQVDEQTEELEQLRAQVGGDAAAEQG